MVIHDPPLKKQKAYLSVDVDAQEPNISILRQWKKSQEITQISNNRDHEGAYDVFPDTTATSIFLKLLGNLLDTIVFETNLYGTQKNLNLNVKPFEILNFIGINFLMGYNRLPSWRHYWSGAQDLGVPFVSNCMTRLRFDQILSNLHLYDNTCIPTNNKDKLIKLKPMINHLNYIFNEVYSGTKELSVDESMIIFKGRSSIKQYNPMKPIKRGYKLWCLSDQKGYTKKFIVYQGKEEIVDDFKEFGLGERVVLQLTKEEWNKNKLFFFDNYFTSIGLLEKLKAEGCLACGTIRSNRRGIPELQDDKKLERGTVDYQFSNTGIGIYKWKDTKSVFFASNYHGSEQTSVLRKNKQGVSMVVPSPQVAKDYNNYMGGVDHADQLRSSYAVNRRSKKWWHRLFWGMLDILFVNSFIIYKELNGLISLLEYRRILSQGLITQKELPTPTRGMFKKKVSPDCNAKINKKRRGKKFSIPDEVRFGNRGIHCLKFDKLRGRCEVCAMGNIQSRPHSKCTHCNIFLCANEKKNCFASFHNML